MLKLKKGKKKTQISTILVCDKCSDEFICINDEMKNYMKDKYIDNNIYSHSDDCIIFCGRKLRQWELIHDRYAEE